MLNHFEDMIWGPKLQSPFLSALQGKGVEFLHGAEKFHQGEIFF